ncbi:MAG: hypothetical protein AVDCRST_MAG27-3337, partial [uncultured Craurococcus sp.]
CCPKGRSCASRVPRPRISPRSATPPWRATPSSTRRRSAPS